MNHPAEIEWYEECINRKVSPDKDEFKHLIKKLELWNIYKKIGEWFAAFQPKDRSKSLSSIYTNDFYGLFD